MNDVMTVALERQRKLRGELAEIEDFISKAESLLRNAKPDAEPRAERTDRPDETVAQVPSEYVERPQIVEFPEAVSEPVVRNFPWSNAQVPVRRTGADDDRPTRRNLIRRAAG